MDLGEILKKIKSNLWLLPEAKFDGLTKDTGYTASFVYLVICLIISIPLRFVTDILVYGNNALTALVGAVIGVIVTVPLVYISYFMMHLIIKLLGGARGLLRTVQIYIYGSTAALIFSYVPILGFIASLVALANVVFGVKRIHDMSLFRAILAVVVIPVVLTLLLVLLGLGYLMF
jgi:hypothetical protein